MHGTATGTNRSHFRQAARKNVIADNPHGSCMPGDESLAQPDVRWRRKYVRGSSLPGGVDLTDDSHSREWRRGAWLWVGVEIGRASCRERVCQYVSISVVAV